MKYRDDDSRRRACLLGMACSMLFAGGMLFATCVAAASPCNAAVHWSTNSVSPTGRNGTGPSGRYFWWHST